MTIGEKLKAARLAANLSQEVLAEKVSLSSRTIRFYEKDERLPDVADMIKLATAVGVPTEYFLPEQELGKVEEQEAFLQQAKEAYGARGKAQAQLILDQTSALFAGGELAEEDQEAFFRTMSEIYFDAKQKSRKYTPKKHRAPKNK